MKKVAKKKIEKYVTETTFEKHMTNIAKSFDRHEKVMVDIQEVMTLILKEMKQMQEENKYFRENISNLYGDGVSYDRRLSNLTV